MPQKQQQKKSSTKKGVEFLSPTVDIVFKTLFGDEKDKDIVLADFLSAVLNIPIGNFQGITILDTQRRKKKKDDKLIILDLKLQLKGGDYINVEMQASNFDGMKNRILYYMCDLLSGQMKEGDNYDELKPVVSIVITDYILFKDKKAAGKYHSEFGFLEKEKHYSFTDNDLLTIHALELPKLGEQASGGLSDWLNFFKAKSEEDFMQLANRRPAIKRAVSKLELMSKSDSFRFEYENRIKALRDQRARELTAARIGREEGIQEGILKGRVEGELIGEAKGIAKVLNLIKRGHKVAELEKELLAGRSVK